MQPLDRRTLLGTGLALAAAPRAFAQDAAGGAPPLAGARTRFAANLELWWGKLPFLDRIRHAAELGFPAVEFWPWRGKDLDGIARTCREAGVEIAQFLAWGFEPGMNDPANHDRVEAEIRASCEVAKKHGVKKMCIIGGNDQPGMSREQMHANIVTALKRVAPIAEDHDVMLAIEPLNIRVDHKGHCLFGTAPAVAICRAVGSSHVKVLWDLYHAQIDEGDLCGRLREGFDQLGYVQLADHPGRNEPGTGEIHYPRVLKELHDLGYRGYVGVECHPSAGEPAAARALAAASNF